MKDPLEGPFNHEEQLAECQEWQKRLASIPDEEWFRFGAHESLYRDCEWWNVKFYPGADAPGDLPRQTRHGTPEVPYGRHFAYPSRGRFAPTGKDVSWWARDHGVATCETDPNFRNNPPLDGAEYFRRLTALPSEPVNQYGYPEPRKIFSTARFLDLTREDQGFFESAARHGLCVSAGEFRRFLKSRGEAAYPASWAISNVAMRQGYIGVIYSSSRAPSGMFDHIMACFDESLMIWPYVGKESGSIGLP
jgi:hypothetical protein